MELYLHFSTSLYGSVIYLYEHNSYCGDTNIPKNDAEAEDSP
jgi:hypothetical protein